MDNMMEMQAEENKKAEENITVSVDDEFSANKEDNVDKEKLKRAEAQRKRLLAEVKKLKEAEAVEANAKKAQAEAKKRKEEAEKEVKRLQREKDVLLKIAGRIKETPSHRRMFAVKGFFDIVRLFNSEADKDFSRKCNSIQDTELVMKALLSSAVYNEEKDWVGINGQKFRALIADEKEKYDKDIEEAKEILQKDIDMD